MHANSEDNLKAFERRLTEWRPTTEGLDSDAMLYQAGLEAGRHSRGRSVWPALSFILAVACVGLGTWSLTERAGHQALAQQIREHRLATNVARSGVEVVSALYVPSSNDYFQLRRLADQDWLTSPQSIGTERPMPPTNADIPRAGQFDRFRDQ